MSTLTNALVSQLANEGIEVSEVETVKNGVVCTGYRLNNGTNVMPVIYYSSGETVESFVERARKVAKAPTPQLDVESIISRERLIANTILCVQKKSTEPIIKRSLLNLELYVRLRVDFGEDDSTGSIKVTPQIIEKAGVTEEELFEAARRNSIERVTFCTMAEAIGIPDDLPERLPFYIGTYSDKSHGAGIMALPDVLDGFCERNGFERLLILPSSTEEVLLIPDDGSSDPEILANMVNDVNNSVVDPTLQLNPTVYLYEKDAGIISIISAYGEEA